MLGAAAKLSRCPCVSASSTAQRIPSACSSISLTSVSRISRNGAPFAIRSSTRRWLSRSAARVRRSVATVVILEVLYKCVATLATRTERKAERPFTISSSGRWFSSPDARTREEQRSHLLCPPRRFPVTRVGGDDGAHHHDLQLPCECVGVAHARIRGQLPQERAYRLDVGFRGLSNRVPSLAVLEQRFDKRAGLEIGPTEPFVEDIENSKQPLGRCVGAVFHLLLQPGARPQLLAAAQEGEGEVLLGGIVAIQRHLRHARARADGIDSYCTDTVPGKELVRGPVDALSCAGRAGGGLDGTTSVHTGISESRQHCLCI